MVWLARTLLKHDFSELLVGYQVDVALHCIPRRAAPLAPIE
jgi:hypothetical protein